MEVCMFEGNEYSEGAVVCANGRELKCRNGSWHETGYPCGENLVDANKTMEISEEEAAAFEQEMAAHTFPQGVYTRYTKHIRYDMQNAYFAGAIDAPQLCSGINIQNYRIPIDYIQEVGPYEVCRYGGGSYQKIVYYWPD